MKKIISLILAVIMLLSIAGCKNSPVSKDGSSTKAPSSNTKSGASTVAADPTKIPMPNRTVTNKVVTYYGWTDFDDKSPRGFNSLLKKESGITMKGTFGAHVGYWDTLATLIASGNSPDLVVMPNWNCIPTPMVNELIQPQDDIIDFNSSLWDDTRQYFKYVKWNGKNYMGVHSVYINGWLFYNKKMFKDYGIKTPKEYYKEDDWTWDNFKKVSDQFVAKKADGTIDVTGVSFYNNGFQASTGLELVESDGKGSYKLNLRENNITKMMNLFYSMGQGGSNSISFGNSIPGAELFAQGKVAMCNINVWALTSPQWASLFKSDSIDWIIMPKMDKGSSYYNELALNLTFGIPVGAKNIEGAAQSIEFHKWLSVGSNISSYVPRQDNAASLKYKIKFGTETSDQLTAEQIAWTKELTKYPMTSFMWQSWISSGGTIGAYPGINDVLSGKKWSEVLESVYPSIDATLKSNFTNK